jgi:ribosomal protein S18 acetylase RimI-like enzyme
MMLRKPSADREILMSIRPYRRADRARCAIIYVDARHLAFPWVPVEDFSVDDFIRDTIDEEIAVAEGRIDGGPARVLGFVSVFAPGHFIHHLYIDPQCRRLGIGQALLRRTVASHGGPWRLKCIIANAQAMAFYRAEGWVEEGRGEDGLGAYATLRFDRKAADLS